MPEGGDKPDPPERQEPPEYNVYRSRPSLRDRIGKPDLSSLGGRFGRSGDKPPKSPGLPDDKPTWRKVLRWVGIFAVGWLILSFLAFAISAQIQKGKLADGVQNVIDGGPFLIGGQTILVLGTDVRSGAFAGP